MKKNIVGPRIRKIRESKKPPVTQAELAARLATQGITLDRSAISRIEKQERQLNDRELFAIAKALRVDPEELIESKL